LKLSPITDFIKKELKEKIRQDLWNYKIGNEEDLQSSVYYNLRKFIDKHKFENLKISGKYTIKGTPIWKKKKNKRTKKEEWVESNFIMPDFVISEIQKSVKKALVHKIVFELKATSPGLEHTPNFDNKVYQKDFNKLNALEKTGLKAYYVFIDSDGIQSEKITKKQINEQEFYVSPRKKEVKKNFEILVVNRFVDPETRKKLKDIELKDRRDKQKRMFRTYEDDIDPRFPDGEEKLASKKSKRKKNPRRVAASKSAWKKSPKLIAKRKKSKRPR